MFTAQWFNLGGMRCSPLNAALCAMTKNKEYSIIMVGRT
ncbi:glyoxalase/bleomycin resistance/dioxygenase family protein, partial [Vibrio parahaemolyticus]